MAAGQDVVARLYEIANILDSAQLPDAAPEHEKLFDEILKAAEGTTQAKILSAQLIPKYVKHFSASMHKALNTLMDLCESEDNNVLIVAIRALPVMAKDSPADLPKITDILAQLLQTEAPLEVDNVKRALVYTMQLNPQATLAALFKQILDNDEILRDKAIKFIFERVDAITDLVKTNAEAQKYITTQVKAALKDASGAEFQTFVDLLSKLPIHAGNKTDLLGILADHIEANTEFKPEEEDITRLLTCLRIAKPFFEKGEPSERVARFLVDKVFPVLSQFNESQQSQFIKLVAELAPNVSGNEAKVLFPFVFTLFNTYVVQAGVEKKTNFTICEAILLAIHFLAPMAAGLMRTLCGITVMTGQPSDMEGEPGDRKDFDARLKNLEDTTTKYIKKVKKALVDIQANTTITKEEKETKKTSFEHGLRSTQNSLSLVQALQKPTPTFLKLTPSWNPPPAPTHTPQQGARGGINNGGKAGFGNRVLINNNKPAQQTTTKTPPPTTTVRKPAAVKPTPTTTTPTTTPKAAANGGEGKSQRPTFGQVYQPPKRSEGTAGKRKLDDTTATTNGGGAKKVKGRGVSKF